MSQMNADENADASADAPAPESSRRPGSQRSGRSGKSRRSGRSRSSRRKPTWKTRLRASAAPLLAIVVMVLATVTYLSSHDVPGPAPSSAADLPTPGKMPIERTSVLAPLRLPADDAAHGSGMEWWYYSGILKDDAGQRHAFHVAVFVANGLVKNTAMHVALTDLQTGKRRIRQSRTGGFLGKDVANGFDFQQEGWQIAGSGPLHTVQATLEGASLALELADPNPPVAHRAAGSITPGLLDFGTSGISYYYSRPRMAAKGELIIDGKPVAVSGDVWFDHQWGEFDVLSLGWNWFALHLTDGSDLMLYALFDGKGNTVLTAGTRSTASGSTPLQTGDVEMTPLKRWTSPTTQVAYPVEWHIRLPTGMLNVQPLRVDSEFDSSATTANVYWEGAVKFSGSAEGEGFMELSGYDRLSANAARAARK